MKIIVVGGSHGLGKQTVIAALAKGHEVTVLSRNPERIGLKNNNLKFVAADITKVDNLSRVIAGHDAIICTLGLPTRLAIGPPFAKKSYVLSNGVQNILAALNQVKVKRFLCVTAIGAGDSVNQCSITLHLVLRRGLPWLFKQKDEQEKLIKASTVNWTIIRPAALTNGRVRGAIVIDKPKDKCGLLTHVSRADIAETFIDSINDKSSYQKALSVMYPPRFGDSVRWVLGNIGIG